jgi:predicted dehydrogenase
MIMTVNAGVVPKDHWTQDHEVGGGRIIGEACHFIDLLRFLAGSPIVSVNSAYLADESSTPKDTANIQLSFKDGSIGTINYFANGHKALAKERLEVFAGGRVLTLDNFRKLKGWGWPGFSKMNSWCQDKGHVQEVKALVKAVSSGGSSPIQFNEIIEVTRATLRAAQV